MALSKSAQANAERIGRNMLKQLEQSNRDVSHEVVLELSYDLVEQTSDTDAAHSKWLDMRSVAEGIVFASHPEWDEITI